MLWAYFLTLYPYPLKPKSSGPRLNTEVPAKHQTPSGPEQDLVVLGTASSPRARYPDSWEYWQVSWWLFSRHPGIKKYQADFLALREAKFCGCLRFGSLSLSPRQGCTPPNPPGVKENLPESRSWAELHLFKDQSTAFANKARWDLKWKVHADLKLGQSVAEMALGQNLCTR